VVAGNAAQKLLEKEGFQNVFPVWHPAGFLRNPNNVDALILYISVFSVTAGAFDQLHSLLQKFGDGKESALRRKEMAALGGAIGGAACMAKEGYEPATGKSVRAMKLGALAGPATMASKGTDPSSGKSIRAMEMGVLGGLASNGAAIKSKGCDPISGKLVRAMELGAIGGPASMAAEGYDATTGKSVRATAMAAASIVQMQRNGWNEDGKLRDAVARCQLGAPAREAVYVKNIADMNADPTTRFYTVARYSQYQVGCRWCGQWPVNRHRHAIKKCGDASKIVAPSAEAKACAEKNGLPTPQ
jgi:hypothetical protein